MGFLTRRTSMGQGACPPRHEAGSGELDKLKKWYSDELKRKDAIIEELKKTNLLLMKTALKRSAEQQKIKDSIDDMKKKLDKGSQ